MAQLRSVDIKDCLAIQIFSCESWRRWTSTKACTLLLVSDNHLGWSQLGVSVCVRILVVLQDFSPSLRFW